MTIEQKKHFTESLREYVGWANANNQQNLGQALPCHVVFNAGPIVTVAFDITTANNATFPQVTCPVLESYYIRLPIQVGDKGIVLSANTLLGGISGLGGGLADFNTTPPNLSALVFIPVGNANWNSVNPNAVVITAPNSGPIILDATSVVATQNFSAGNGLTGTFTSGTGQTIQVTGGIITNIY